MAQPQISSAKLLAIWFLVLKHDIPFIASWLISENNLLNFDGTINVLDVVLTVNLILCADCPDNYNSCSDINGDELINVLDVVSLVNLILGRI